MQLLYRKKVWKNKVGGDNVRGGSTDICNNPEVRNVSETLLGFSFFRASCDCPGYDSLTTPLIPHFNSRWWDFTCNTMAILKTYPVRKQQREKGGENIILLLLVFERGSYTVT